MGLASRYQTRVLLIFVPVTTILPSPFPRWVKTSPTRQKCSPRTRVCWNKLCLKSRVERRLRTRQERLRKCIYSVNERINELSSLMRNNTEHTLRTRKCRQLLNFTMVWAKIYLASFTRQPYTSYKLLSSWGDLTSGNGQHPKLAGPVRQQVYWSEHELPSLHFIVTLASSPPTWNNIKKHHLNSTFNSL